MKTRSFIVSIIFSAISLSSAIAQWSNDPLVNTQISIGGGGSSFGGNRIKSSIASDGNGGAIFVFESPTKNELYAQRVDASGNLMWGPNGVTVSANYWKTSSHIISDGAGGIFVAYSELDSSHDMNGGLYRSGDVYAQRIDASGSTLWNQRGVPIFIANSGQFPYDIISDGVGGVIIACSDARNTVAGEWSLYVQRASSSGDILWQQNGVFIDTLGAEGGYKLVSDGLGGAIIGYTETDSVVSGVPDVSIYAQRLNSAGSKLWTPRANVCTALRQRYNLVMISDGANGAIMTWEDGRIYGNYDIFAQRIDGSGKSLWAANGINVCSAKYDQTNPAIVSDGSGGAFIAWSDHRDGFSNNIFAERIDKSGTSLWTPNGISIFKAPNYLASNSFLSVSMTIDGSGGVIMAWADARNDGPNFRDLNYDIFAQRINADSTVQWKTNGVAVSTSPGNQFNPVVVSSGGGSAIVSWDDYRDAVTQNIFAQRINTLGILGGSSIAIPIQTFPPNGTLLTDTTVILRWGKVNGAIAYQLQCGIDPTFNTQLLVDLNNLTDTMHLITGLNRSSIYYWRIRSIGNIAHHKGDRILSTPGDWSQGFNFKTPGASNFVSEDRINELALEIYPNPAEGYANISYSMSMRSPVKIEIFDPLGQHVMTLQNETEDRGTYNRQVDLHVLNTGSYVLRLTADGLQRVKKFTIIR